jgi:DNA helicase HerA-like ATPase
VAYAAAKVTTIPPQVGTLTELQRELELVNRFRRDNPGHAALISKSGNAIFEADHVALLEFLEPQSGRSGVTFLQPYRIYHDPKAGDFMAEILQHLDKGQTVILDLGNANPQVMTYFSDELSKAVFKHQVDKFTNNKLGAHYIQLYFEEAHNLFPQNGDVTTIYSRFAKEGAKYHLGMVYSTQSPTTVNKDLLAQTENFFIAHLSSQDQVNALGKVNVAYESLKGDILQAKTPGYMRMLTRSHRFVVSVQARKFVPPNAESNGSLNGRS